MAAAGSARAQGAPRLIRLQYATFDPLRGVPPVDPALRAQPQNLNEVGHYLVQLTGHARPEWLAALRRTGVVIQDYVPDDTFVVRATARQAAALPAGFRFVRWTGVFHPAYKIDPAALAPTQKEPLRALTFTPGDRSALVGRMRQFGLQVVGAGNTVIETVPSPQLAVQLARTLEVKWVRPRPRFKLVNDRAAAIMGVGTTSGVRARRLYGAGQVVAVCDTGLDTGSVATVNDDFKGRVLSGIGLGPSGKWADPEAHGTHVAGSVLGSGRNSGSNPNLHDYDKSFAGVAPEASLIVQGLDNDPLFGLLGLPLNLYDLFTEPYNQGARVHTNSWASPDVGTYTTDCASVDQFVYDHDDMVVLFAASNDGDDADQDGVIDPGSMGDPAAAKNVITVGASESYRPPTENWGGSSKGTWGGMWPWAPFTTDYISNNIEGMAGFSSRGPCADGRIKPDLVAPGTDIVSVWSRAAAQAGSNGWGEFSGAYTDSRPLSKYVYMGGTSMATPLTAGAAALVREYYVTRQSWQPSAALVKATMINAAHDMSPGQYGTGAFREMGPRPNGVEGFGRVDLARALFPSSPRRVTWLDRPPGLNTAETLSLNYAVRGNSEPLSVTLVWTDAPGSPVAAQALVNDLDLQVTAPDGTVYYPNGGTAPDTLNNVEQIDIPRPIPGTYTLTVTATNVPMGPQSYALVASSDGGPQGGRFPDITRPQVKIVQPATGASVKGTISVQVQALDDRGLDRVMLQLDNGVFLGTRYAAPYTFSWRTTGFALGQHTLTAIAVDTSGNKGTDSIAVYVR